MCISVKKLQQTKVDVSQKPLIQKMHTEPEILNWMVGGFILHSDLHLCDSPAKTKILRLEIEILRLKTVILRLKTKVDREFCKCGGGEASKSSLLLDPYIVRKLL